MKKETQKKSTTPTKKAPVKDKKKSAPKKENTKELEVALAAEKDKFIRLFAEFENFRKRSSKERIALFDTANKEVMIAILPVLDDFERAFSQKSEQDNEGFKLIYNKLMDILSSKGLSLVETKSGDEFDAEIHEAITQIPAPSEELKGKIIDITEKGYQLGENIIRFPKVVVGK